MHGTSAAVHRLVQFLVDLIQDDTSITISADINTNDGYNTFFITESKNLREYIDFKDNPNSLRNFFAFIIRETNTVDTIFIQEWLTNTVDVLHSMSTTESSPTMQVFAGYCCGYVLGILGQKRKQLSDDDLGVNSQNSFVTLCCRLCSAIFHAYEICLSST